MAQKKHACLKACLRSDFLIMGKEVILHYFD